jgi:hypothetical protein
MQIRISSHVLNIHCLILNSHHILTFIPSVFISAVCGRIDLKFGRDLHVNLLFPILVPSAFLLAPPLTPPPPPPTPPPPQKLNFLHN